MPALDATTTLAFGAVGLSPSVLYGWVQYMFSYAISVGIWIFQALLPFWLVLAIIGAFTGIVFAIVAWGRGRH